MGELKWWHARRGPPLLLLLPPQPPRFSLCTPTCSYRDDMQHGNMRNPANTVAMTTQPEDNCFTAHNTTHRLGCFGRMILLLLFCFFFCSMKQRRVALFMVIRVFSVVCLFFDNFLSESRLFIPPALRPQREGGHKHKWAVLPFGSVWNKRKLCENVTSALEMPLVLRGVALLAASSPRPLT